METTARVAKGGIITFKLPKDELERLELHAGDLLSVETTPEELGVILITVDQKSTN